MNNRQPPTSQPPTLDESDVNESVLGDSRTKGDSSDADGPLIWAQEESRAFHVVKMAWIYGVPILAGVFVIVYIWHLIGFPCMRWLKDPDLAEMRSISVSVLSGVVSSIAVSYFFRNK